MWLRRLDVDAVRIERREAVDAETLRGAAAIVESVRQGGDAALRAEAERFGDLAPDGRLFFDRAALEEAHDALPADERALLERTAARIRAFAQVQRAALRDVEVPVPGGVAGHSVLPIERAGCYAPGGRFPLPSSVLMTVVPARVAGVRTVWVASPRPSPATLAAAAIAGADGLVAAGGAQAIGALAYGAGPVAPCDVVVGPGNRWVTAAKKWVAGQVAIDMLAGPSELVVLAGAGSDPERVAADLLAQAEHDADAVPVLVTTQSALADAVEVAIGRQLATLPTAGTAEAALRNGFAVIAPDEDAAVALCDRLAPEHLQVVGANAPGVASRCSHYGALFVGEAAAEVLGDYGIGPNHVLPTGGTARSAGGLSVLTFLRIHTFLRIDDPAGARSAVEDAVALARIEGLEGHARAAALRLNGTDCSLRETPAGADLAHPDGRD